ncbi:MAG: RHS repeat-associated core domain-containing protein, partial [Myxococcales bacterium]|nr:RHS repeat-associated core domain-containing protein [Myxococcales bacterium]
VWRAHSAGVSVDHRGEGDPGVDLPFGLAGHYRDPETGLLYSRHRYLDPTTARFLSPDPTGLFGGLDPHAYVDDPATMIDPLGLRGQPATPSTLPGVPAEPIPTAGRAEEGPIAPELAPALPPGAPTELRAPRPSPDAIIDPDLRVDRLLKVRAVKPPLAASCKS